VWACVRLLADAVSTLPLDVYRRGERDPLPELPPLLKTPAAGLSLNEWLYSVMTSLLLRGNCYGIVTGRSGSTLLPAQVDLAHPDRMAVTVLADGRVSYRLNGKELDPADVWHVRAYPFPGTVLGLSPVEYARQTIGLGLAAEKFGAQWFGDGSVPSGVIYADRDPKEEGAKKLKAQWMAAHRNNREPAVLAGARFEPISVKPEESQFLGTLDAQRQLDRPHLRRATRDDRRHHRRAARLHLTRDAQPRPAHLHRARLAGPAGERHLGPPALHPIRALQRRRHGPRRPQIPL
jgi:HK97 family phage portal protein